MVRRVAGLDVHKDSTAHQNKN